MSRWRPALRMARRDLLAHRGRSLLMAVLVALPVLVAVVVAQLHHHTRWEGERAARASMGGADALVEVSPYDRVEVDLWSGGDASWFSVSRDGMPRQVGERQVPPDRAAAGVDVAAALPAGARVVTAPTYSTVALDTGGTGYTKIADARDPMMRGLADVSAGVPPAAADEVAINLGAAVGLDLVDADGEPRPDATIGLLDGTRLRVVGIIDPRSPTGYVDGVQVLAAPGSLVAERADAAADVSDPKRRSETVRYLVDLPDDLGVGGLRALADSLASSGIAMMPRDAVLHPARWDVQDPPSAVDVTALAIGALVVMFGLIEVVLLVGSAFAVGARRQIRDLGLVAASGGAARDVRTILLAQGLVLGAGASVVGAAAGLLVVRLGTPTYEALARTRVWTQDVDWLSVVGLTLLGATTGVLAALVPAWGIARMSPVDALAGEFSRPERRLRVHGPAVSLALVGLLVVLGSGWWIAAEFADPGPQAGPVYVEPSPVPVVIGAVGLAMLLGGLVWLSPHVVHRMSGAARHLPVSGRFAVREATRHRFRTAASAVSLMVVVAGTVFAGFAVQAASAQAVTDAGGQDARMLSVEVGGTGVAARQESAARAVDVLTAQVGEVETLVLYAATDPDAGPYDEAYLGGRNAPGEAVRVVDREVLQRLAEVDAEALDVFDTGGVVTTSSTTSSAPTGVVRMTFDPRGRAHDGRWELPAATARPTGRFGAQQPTAWISPETAADLGLVPSAVAVDAVAGRDLTRADVEALGARGIVASSQVATLEAVALARLAVLGGAAVLTLLVVGIAVALSAAEGRADQATMAAIGAGRGRRRRMGAVQGAFIGVVGTSLGLVVGLPAGAALMQVDGQPGTPVPWLMVLGVLGVPALAWAAGWLTTSTRLTLVRRTG